MQLAERFRTEALALLETRIGELRNTHTFESARAGGSHR